MSYSAVSSSISIPHELIYHIVDYCHDDAPTLRSCALVSRSWVSVAQQHLFSSITVQNHDDGVPQHDLPALIHHLTEHPSLCPYIAHLVVLNSQSTPSEICALADKLTRLHTLVLQNMHFVPCTSALPLAVLSSSLESLTIKGCVINDIGHPWRLLFDLVNMFSSIDNLTLQTSWYTERGIVAAPLLRAPPVSEYRKTQVRTLDFSQPSDFQAAFVDYTIRSIDIDSISSLRLTHWYDHDTAHLPVQALIDAAKGLRTFYINVESLLPSRLEMRAFSLAACELLETVQFFMSISPWTDLSAKWRHVLTMLSTLPHPSHLSSIQFDIHVVGQSNSRPAIEDIEWRMLEPILIRFKGVRTLNIRFLCDHPSESFKTSSESADPLEIVRHELANVARRCTLQLTWTSAKDVFN